METKEYESTDVKNKQDNNGNGSSPENQQHSSYNESSDVEFSNADDHSSTSNYSDDSDSNDEDYKTSSNEEYSGSIDHDEFKKHHHMNIRPIGLAMLFVLLVLFFFWTQIESINKDILESNNKIALTNSRTVAFEDNIKQVNSTLGEYQNSVIGLDLKKTLLSLDELIENSNGSVRALAINSRRDITSLLKEMNVYGIPLL